MVKVHHFTDVYKLWLISEYCQKMKLFNIFFEFSALSHFFPQNSPSAALGKHKNYDKTIKFLPGKYTGADLVT